MAAIVYPEYWDDWQKKAAQEAMVQYVWTCAACGATRHVDEVGPDPNNRNVRRLRLVCSDCEAPFDLFFIGGQPHSYPEPVVRVLATLTKEQREYLLRL